MKDIGGSCGRKCRSLLITFIFLLPAASLIRAQNMPHEAGLWIAVNGQKPLIAPDSGNRGFFTNPTIEHLYYQAATNGVQNLSVFLEHTSETRSWDGLWTNFYFNGGQKNVPASVDETLDMTTLGIETVRNLISESGFRFGVGLAIGYGLGGASANVRDTSGTVTTYNSATLWNAFFLSGFARIRYSLLITSSYDLGIMLMGRYWSFPALGPVSSGGEAYNGPSLRAISELGYMAGISVGF